MIRVLVSARSAIVRAGLEAVVREAPGLTLAGAAEPDKVTDALGTLQADAVLYAVQSHLDDLPGDIAAAASRAAVVLLIEEAQPGWLAEALRSGVRALLPAESGAAEIAAAIEAAAAGLVVLHPQDVPALLSAPVFTERASEAPGQALTPREIEVLRLMADGEGNKGIAWRLGISDHTVKFHVASIMSKLHAASRTEAVTLGVRRGLILL